MTTILTSIPEAVLRQAKNLAERDHIPLEQLISLAVTQAVGVWSTEPVIQTRASLASREKFRSALDQVPETMPDAQDRL